MKKKLSIILSALLVNGFSYASEEVGAEEELFPFFGGEEMISIATGYSKAISKAPAVASVITSEDIKRMGATDIDMVLETIPGLHVARDVVAHNPIYTFRGIYADFNPQVLMLINGVPVTNLFHGDRNLVWGGMPVQAIERIEVIRGPGSAIYGADAFAGVINVVTKGPEDISGVSSGIRYGSFRTKDAWLSVGDSAGGVKYSAVIEMHKTEGQDEKIEADAQSLLDMLSGTNASYAPESMNLGRESWDAGFN
ncbi:MAG: TonB-dependent receptor plug domain-containing protein [Porticoccaceae bacterium]